MAVVTNRCVATYRLDNRHGNCFYSVMPTTGPELRKERRDAEVSVQAMADRMKTSRARIHGWERSVTVPPDFSVEYRVALQAIRDAREATPS